MFRQGTRVVVSKLVTTQASAAQQRLSGFKITLRISAAHLQYDDTDCRRALRAFRWAIYKRAHKPTTCPVAPSHVSTSVIGARQESVLAELTSEENACSYGKRNLTFHPFVWLVKTASCSDYPQCGARKRF